MFTLLTVFLNPKNSKFRLTASFTAWPHLQTLTPTKHQFYSTTSEMCLSGSNECGASTPHSSFYLTLGSSSSCSETISMFKIFQSTLLVSNVSRYKGGRTSPCAHAHVIAQGAEIFHMSWVLCVQKQSKGLDGAQYIFQFYVIQCLQWKNTIVTTYEAIRLKALAKNWETYIRNRNQHLLKFLVSYWDGTGR